MCSLNSQLIYFKTFLYHIQKNRGLSFRNFLKKGWVQNFPIKIRVGKIGGCSKIGAITNINLPFLKLSFSLCVVCLFCSFTPILSVFFVFHRKDIVFFNLVSRYMASASE